MSFIAEKGTISCAEKVLMKDLNRHFQKTQMIQIMIRYMQLQLCKSFTKGDLLKTTKEVIVGKVRDERISGGEESEPEAGRDSSDGGDYSLAIEPPGKRQRMESSVSKMLVGTLEEMLKDSGTSNQQRRGSITGQMVLNNYCSEVKSINVIDLDPLQYWVHKIEHQLVQPLASYASIIGTSRTSVFHCCRIDTEKKK